MKKAIIISILYCFALPVLFNLAGLFIDPFWMRQAYKYPVSFILEQLLDGVLSALPCFVILLFAYNHVIKGKETERGFFTHKFASWFSLIVEIIIISFLNVLIFMIKYANVKDKIWKLIYGYGIFPLTSIILALIIYGIGYIIGRSKISNR